MKLTLIKAFCLSALITMMIGNSGVSDKMNADELNLPKTVDVWHRPESNEMVNSENIFDYMNGAGELYLGFRFNHLEIFDYVSDDQGQILVELYFMKTSDDAFGLLSLD
jgi:hypothetical protein